MLKPDESSFYSVTAGQCNEEGLGLWVKLQSNYKGIIQGNMLYVLFLMKDYVVIREHPLNDEIIH